MLSFLCIIIFVFCFQVTYQLKILTTAFFAVVVLKRQLKKWQWLALVILAAGVAIVQLSSTEKAHVKSHLPEQSKIIGFSAALAACFLSGFAGIYFEKVLKESDISVSAIVTKLFINI